MNIKSLNTKNSVIFDKVKHNENTFKINEGDIIKVKLLEYLGGGKIVVDLKGQRVVANTNLMMEEGQEISVLIKKINEDKIILQILSDNLADKEYKDDSEPFLNDPISEIKKIIDGIKHSKNLLADYEIKKLSDLLDKVFIHITDSISKEDLVDQIWSLLLLSSHNYENKDDFIHVLFTLPIFFDEEETAAEIGYSYSKNDEDENKASNVSIRFDLYEIGKIEFIVNILDNSLNCFIKTDNHEIYDLIKKTSSELENSFIKLGYDVDNLNCIIQNFRNPLYYHTKNLIDKNV
jgi:hypothetical protein